MGRCGLVGGWLSWMVRASDSLGSNYELNCRGSTSYKTVTGGILSLACIGITVIYLYQQFSSMLEKTNLRVTDVIDYPQSALKIELVESQLLPVILLINKTSNVALPSAFQPSVATFVGELQQTSIDVSKNIAVSRTLRFDVKPCGQLLNKKPYRAYFDEPRFTKSMEIIPRCLEVPEDASLLIFGGRFDPEFSSFRLAAYPCSQTDCLPSDQLTELYFSVTSLKKFIKFNDFQNPVQSTFIAQEGLNILPGNIGFELRTYLEKSTVRDQLFLLSEPSNERVFSSIKEANQVVVRRASAQGKCSPTEISNGECSAYFSIDYISSGITHDIVRFYPDFLQVLSDVGGFKEIIFISVSVFYLFYNEYMKKQHLRLQFLSPGDLRVFFAHKIADDGSNNKLEKDRLSRGTVVPIHPHTQGKQDNTLLGNRPRSKQTSSESLQIVMQDHQQATPESQWRIENLCIKDDILQSKHNPTNNNPKPTPETAVISLDNRQRENSWSRDLEDLLELNSDISHISKEMTCFGVLKEVLFTPYQLKLLPLVSIELHRKRLQQQRLSAEGTQSPTDPLVQNICSFVGESLKYKEALDCLTRSVDSAARPIINEPGILETSLPSVQALSLKMDHFIFSNLPEFVKTSIPVQTRSKESSSEFDMRTHTKQKVEDMHLPISDAHVHQSGQTHTKTTKIPMTEHKHIANVSKKVVLYPKMSRNNNLVSPETRLSQRPSSKT